MAHLPLVRVDDAPAGEIEELRAQDDAEIAAATGDVPDALRRSYADVLLASMVHELNAVRGLLGEPDRLEFAGIRDDGVTLVMDFGATRCVTSWVDLPGMARYQQEWAFFGLDRRARLVFPSPYLRNAPTSLYVEEGEAGTVRSSERLHVESYDEAFRRELVEFHEAIVGERPPGPAPRTRSATWPCVRRSWRSTSTASAATVRPRSDSSAYRVPGAPANPERPRSASARGSRSPAGPAAPRTNASSTTGPITSAAGAPIPSRAREVRERRERPGHGSLLAAWSPTARPPRVRRGRGRRRRCPGNAFEPAGGHQDHERVDAVADAREVVLRAAASVAVTTANVDATPRCVTGMPAAAGAAIAAVTPGTTSKGTPARAHASASSPPRPNTNGSPPFSRTTSRPAQGPVDEQLASMSGWADAVPPGALPTSITLGPAGARPSSAAGDQPVVDDDVGRAGAPRRRAA